MFSSTHSQVHNRSDLKDSFPKLRVVEMRADKDHSRGFVLVPLFQRLSVFPTGTGHIYTRVHEHTRSFY